MRFFRLRDKGLKERRRYRVENGKVFIEIKLKTSKQLFDARDPAPFRERDLDDDAVRYIVAAAEEFSPTTPLKILIYLSEVEEPRPEGDAIKEAIHSFFGYESELLRRTIRLTLKRGRTFLMIGLATLVIFLVLAELTQFVANSSLRFILREGLVITGWVAMWRPIELFLYDWWPLAEKHKYYQNLQKAEVEIHLDK